MFQKLAKKKNNLILKTKITKINIADGRWINEEDLGGGPCTKIERKEKKIVFSQKNKT